VRFPRSPALPLRDAPGRRVPGPRPRDRGLDPGTAARLRSGNGLDLQPPGRLPGPPAYGVADQGRVRRLGHSPDPPRRAGLPLVRLLLAVVPRPAGGDATGQRRRARPHRGGPARRPRATRPPVVVTVPEV